VNEEIDPEGLLEPLNKKVRVLRRKSSSYEEDDDDIPISKRRKSCDGRKKKRGRKGKGKGAKKSSEKENPDNLVIKTEPLDFYIKTETEFNEIVDEFPADLGIGEVPTSFSGILEKNAKRAFK
jgi:hypothetical protein